MEERTGTHRSRQGRLRHLPGVLLVAAADPSSKNALKSIQESFRRNWSKIDTSAPSEVHSGLTWTVHRSDLREGRGVGGHLSWAGAR
jgi:hypothetical protein